MNMLLDRLKQIDPTTYEKVYHGIPIYPRSIYYVFDPGARKPRAEMYKDGWIRFADLPKEAACAWLQACLQEAIRAKKLYFSMTQTTPGPKGQEYRASIRYKRNYVEGEVRLYGEDPWPQIAECDGVTPVESLLKAYIEACEATHDTP